MRNDNTNHLSNWNNLRKKKGEYSNGDEKLQQIWEHSSRYGQDFEPDVEAGLAKLKNRISNTPNTTRRVNMRRWMRMAAAVLVIGLAIMATYRHFSPDVGESIVWIEIQTTTDEQRAIILPDGSEVTLNEDSHLFYADDINTAKKRFVRLEGEAFFQIDRREEQAFIINTSRSEIEVLGTSFNVRAYPHEKQTEVEVSNGMVAFRAIANQKEAILHAREVAVLDKENHISTMAAPTLNRTAWKTGVLSFKETEIEVAIPLIARYYGIQLLNKANLSSCTITGNWKNESMDNVFTLIESLTGLNIEQLSDGVYGIVGDCN